MRALLRQATRRLHRLKAAGAINGIGVGSKISRGRNTGHIALVAYVTRKGTVPRAERVPRHVRLRLAHLGRRVRIPTDVVAAAEVGEACALHAGSSLLGKGTSTCALAWRVSGAAFLLTCAHSFFRPTASPTAALEVKAFDPSLQVHVQIGWVDKWSGIRTSAINTKDDARAALNAGVSVDHLTAGPQGERVVAVRNFDMAPNVQYVFWARGGGSRACGQPVARAPGDSLPMRIQTQDGIVTALYGNFYTLSMAAGDTVEPGDSGTGIFRRVAGGLEWAGVLFGRLGPDKALAFPAPSIAARHAVPI